MSPQQAVSGCGPAGDPVALQFGAFELNLRARELRKHGIRIRIPEQSFCALTLLLEKAGDLVTREELRQRLWPGNTHVEFDDNLNTIIRSIREVLGDSARNPRFVQTTPKQGYRFVAPVSTVRLAPTQPAQVPALAVPVRKGLSKPAMAVAALAVVVFGGWFFAGRNPFGQRSAIAPTPFTSYLGSAGHPTFSPDGSRVAFHWNGDEQRQFHIYVKSLAAERPVQLTAAPMNDRFPAWSPDGRDIAFVRALADNKSAIMLLPVSGGGEREVATIPAGQVPLSWSADGKWLAYATTFPDYVQASAARRSGIFAISLETGESIQVTAPGPDLLGDAHPAFAPDGRRLAFFRISSVGVSDLYTVELGSGLRPLSAPRRLTFDVRAAKDPAWTPDGKEILFVSGRAGSTTLLRVRSSGNPPSPPVLLGGEYAQEPAVSPNGRQIVYERQQLTGTLNTVDLCGPGCTSSAQPRRLMQSLKLARNPAYSPDGNWIAFESYRSGNDEIWVCERDGSNPRQLTFFGRPATGTPRWSPDSRKIVFDSRVSGKGHIFTVDRHGGAPRQLTRDAVEHVVPSWSRDGRWIYYASNAKGEFQVWKTMSDGSGSPVQLTRSGGFYALESFDGRDVYYSKGIAQTSIWKIPASGGQESRAIPSLNLSHSQAFCLGQQGIYFVPSPPAGASASIHYMDIRTGEVTVAAAAGGPSVMGLSIAPGERSVVFSKREADESDLMLAELPR